MSLVAKIKTIQRAVGAEPDGVFGPRSAAAVLAHLARMEMVDAVGPPALPLDERTRKNIATLDPKCRERFEQFTLLAKATAATFGCDYIMISGHRTWEEQDALFAKRPKVTDAAGGYSNHNFGIAADFGVFRGKAYLDESDAAIARQVHEACAVHARRLGFEWGGDWKTFKDYPHFEISNGLAMGAKRLLYKKEGSVL